MKVPVRKGVPGSRTSERSMQSAKRAAPVKKEEEKPAKEMKEKSIEVSLGIPSVPGIHIRTNGSVQNSREDPFVQSVTRSSVDLIATALANNLPSRADLE